LHGLKARETAHIGRLFRYTEPEPVEDPIEILENSTPKPKKTVRFEGTEDVPVVEKIRSPSPVQGVRRSPRIAALRQQT